MHVSAGMSVKVKENFRDSCLPVTTKSHVPLMVSGAEEEGRELVTSVRLGEVEHAVAARMANKPKVAKIFICPLTLKLSRIAARSWQHGKLFLPC